MTGRETGGGTGRLGEDTIWAQSAELLLAALTIPLRGFAKPRNYPPPPMGLSSHLSELRKTDDQGLIDWCPPVMRDTHPKD